MRRLIVAPFIIVVGCTTPTSGSGICRASSPVSDLRPRIDELSAEGDFDGVVETLHTVPPASRDECWYISIGGALHDTWELSRAEQELQQGSEIFPDSSAIPSLLANTYILMGRFSEAEALVQNALDRAPPPDSGLYLRDALARMYRERGDYSAAKKAWDEILREEPDDVNFLLNSTSVEGLLGHLEEVRGRVNRALSVGVSEYGWSVGSQALAFAAHFGGDHAAAAGHLEALLSASEPSFSSVIAELSLMLGHRAQAARDRIEALPSSTLPSPLRVGYAGLLAKLGDRNELDEIMQGEWQTTEPVIRRTLTQALLAIGDPRAVGVAQSLVDSVSDNPLYEHLLGRAMRDAGRAGWEEHAAAAAAACPDNVLFQDTLANASTAASAAPQ